MTRNLKILIGIILSIVLIVILISQISINDIINTLRKISPLYFIIGFILYTISYFFRTIRLKLLIKTNIKFKDMLSIVAIHNMANNILPARTGEFSFIYLLKTKKNISFSESFAALIIARIFDIIAISLLFIVSVVIIGDLPSLISNVLVVLTLFLIVLIILFILSVFHGETVIKNIERFFIAIKINKTRIANFILTKGDEIIQNFRVIRSKKIVICSFFFSLFIWIFAYTITYLLFQEMNIEISIWTVILGSSFLIFTTILPIHSVGGFGTVEGMWTIAFMALGLSKEEAISSGFTVHIIITIYFLILGLIGFVILKVRLYHKK